MKTKLQKQFEEQTPTLKVDHGIEYLQTFITWLHFQVEKLQKQLEPEGEARELLERYNYVTASTICSFNKGTVGYTELDNIRNMVKKWLKFTPPPQQPSEGEIKNIIGKYARRFCKGFDANIISHDSAKAIKELLNQKR